LRTFLASRPGHDRHLHFHPVISNPTVRSSNYPAKTLDHDSPTIACAWNHTVRRCPMALRNGRRKHFGASTSIDISSTRPVAGMHSNHFTNSPLILVSRRGVGRTSVGRDVRTLGASLENTNEQAPGSRSQTTSNNNSGRALSGLVCPNCGTSNTPLWRLDKSGKRLCNACALYLKLHKEARPLELSTGTYRSRRRNAGYEGPNRRLIHADAEERCVVDPPRTPRTSRRPQSCHWCRKRKVGCDVFRPCGSCDRRGLACTDDDQRLVTSASHGPIGPSRFGHRPKDGTTDESDLPAVIQEDMRLITKGIQEYLRPNRKFDAMATKMDQFFAFRSVKKTIEMGRRTKGD
jgi:hypothetical protein